jgi:hypothetical protein
MGFSIALTILNSWLRTRSIFVEPSPPLRDRQKNRRLRIAPSLFRSEHSLRKTSRRQDNGFPQLRLHLIGKRKGRGRPWPLRPDRPRQSGLSRGRSHQRRRFGNQSRCNHRAENRLLLRDRNNSTSRRQFHRERAAEVREIRSFRSRPGHNNRLLLRNSSRGVSNLRRSREDFNRPRSRGGFHRLRDHRKRPERLNRFRHRLRPEGDPAGSWYRRQP